jgi:DNA modification methylase
MTASKPIERKFQCKLFGGDTAQIIRPWPDNIFHCAITSPPYWLQRDYDVIGQLGDENTPEEYVDHLISICKEVKRVLRNDGTFWLNIGDNYCKKSLQSSNLKRQDLVGIPWMVAFALRKDGWYLRSDIIWYKTNPQPESVTTRPSKTHEHIFLLTKTDQYFYDAESIKEPQKEISIRRAFSKNAVHKRKDFNNDNYAISGASQDKTYAKMRTKIIAGETMLRNKRDVWEMATADNTFHHFAIYPEHLVEPCLLAGTSSKGCCPKCKAPWIRTKDITQWEPSCNCQIANIEECIVLDPFNGSGTTGRVCMTWHRKYVGVDINEEYITETRDLFAKQDISYVEADSLLDLL